MAAVVLHRKHRACDCEISVSKCQEYMRANKAMRRIGVFSQGGLKNLGDEALFAAVIQNVRERMPDAEVIGFTVNPEDTELRHGIPTFPVCRLDRPTRRGTGIHASASATPPMKLAGWKQRLKAVPGLAATVRFLRKAVRITREIALEPRFFWESYRRLKGVEVLLVAGSQQLNDIYGPWAFPLTLFRWSFLSRLTGTKFVLLSVGAGPLSSPTSRFLIRRVLRWCSYRSFRDVISSQLVEGLGVGGPNPVYPDLAYSLRLPATRPVPREGKKVVIGVNPVPFYDGRYWATSNPTRYREYIEKFVRFTEWLDKNGYSTLFIPTQVRADVLTIEDIRTRLNRAASSTSVFSGRTIGGIDDLVSEIGRADIVVANRYHGILLSLALNKPVLGIAYHEKSRALLEQVAQGEYVLNAADFTTEDLILKTKSLHANIAQCKKEIASRLAPLRDALEQQYDAVFALIGIAPKCEEESTSVATRSETNN